MSGRRSGFAGNGQPDGDRRRRRCGRGLMVPEAEFRSYYGRPILKEPAWTIEVPWYFFAGGMAGASAPLAVAARMTGNDRLARGALTVAAAGVAVGTPLLVSDLGRPERFHHMLRVFKPTSPMSMGSWVLAGLGPSAVNAAVSEWFGIFPRLGRVAEVVSGLLGPALSTYTAVLVANTAVPVWHEAGFGDARLYLRDEANGIDGAGAFFLLLDEPEVYGFPPDPVSTTRDLPRLWKAAAVAAGVVVTAVAAAVAGGRR